MFLEYINTWLKENDIQIKEKNLIVEHVINHGNKKIELGISNIMTKNTGSFELIDDGTCDIMVVDYESNNSIFYNTTSLKDIDELKKELELFLSKLNE